MEAQASQASEQGSVSETAPHFDNHVVLIAEEGAERLTLDDALVKFKERADGDGELRLFVENPPGDEGAVAEWEQVGEGDDARGEWFLHGRLSAVCNKRRVTVEVEAVTTDGAQLLFRRK